MDRERPGSVRLRKADKVGEREELAVEADALLVPRPQEAQHVDCLVGAAPARCEVNADRGCLLWQSPKPNG